MTRSLTVWWDGVVAGSLALDRHGAMCFAYDSAWIADPVRPPVSFSLPKRPESFSARLCTPFFEGLLPEGAQRDAVAAALGVSPANTFRLLAALGEEVAGALTLCPAGEIPSVPEVGGGGRMLSDDELVELLDTIRTRPFLAGQEGLRLSLAGAQSKLPVVVVGDGIAVPAPGQPTTHILKPPIPGLATTTENEAFAMRLAAALGLEVAPDAPPGTATVAPLYDLMCTVAYPHLAATLAMKIGRRGTLREFRPGTWDRFARNCGLSAPFVRRRVRELCEMACERCGSVAAALVQPGLDEEALHGYAARIGERAGRLARSTLPESPTR